MNTLYSTLIFAFVARIAAFGQEVAIVNTTTGDDGRIQVRIPSSTDYYYVLFCRDKTIAGKEWPVSLTIGEADSTTLSEPLAALPPSRYRVVQYPCNAPADTDGDGIDDITEFQNMGRMAPFNSSAEITLNNGTVCIPDRATFETLSYQGTNVLIDEHLKNLEFVKFYILNANTSKPKVYFMNTVTHRAHNSFASAIGIGGGPGGGQTGQMRGEIVYHPYVAAPSGAPGVYRFEFEPNDSYSFAMVQMAYELLAANMPFLKNDWAYYPMPNVALPRYQKEKALYDSSRIAIVLEDDIYSNISYQPLNIAEGYGTLRLMTLEETPNSRDVVIYEALPNELSRVAGIITTVAQTPLSHVNLRAIQDKVPNAYISKALEIDSIKALIGKYVYYRVEQLTYSIREATMAEVEAFYANIRPSDPQAPVRDLSITRIMPLDSIRFDQWTSFGVKTANLATMRTFGFPDGVIPDGFGVPFYFYDEFMKFNGFYQQAQTMLADSAFRNDYNVQEEMLSEFRKSIKNASMPDWMMTELERMQTSFPEGVSIRCRSSTNNEDLPGFSGAGLYDSKTQHPDEGHIAKSIKQIFASLWNFRAYDEREFYRIDHFAAAMGVLVHPNYTGELANGVGVSMDPLYQNKNMYYLNSQVGEDLVTNPDALSIPEEILLSAMGAAPETYSIVRRSNQLPDSLQVLSVPHLQEMRGYLGTIHNRFRSLYNVSAGEEFAMEIEYKVTSEDVLEIKQARPWVFHDAVSTGMSGSAATPQQCWLGGNYPNPFNPSTTVRFGIPESGDVSILLYDVMGRRAGTIAEGWYVAGNHTVQFTASGLPSGVYFYQLRYKNIIRTNRMALMK